MLEGASETGFIRRSYKWRRFSSIRGKSVIANSRRRRAIESIEKGLCRFEVGLVEPFGKPVEDRLEDRHRIRRTALIAQQPGRAYGGAQFPGHGALPPCPTQRLPVVIFGRRRGSGRALQQQKLAPDAQQLCYCPARMRRNPAESSKALGPSRGTFLRTARVRKGPFASR
jgi:hypothetical protein